MIKRITGVNEAVSTAEWIDLIQLADVDVTSERPASPIEGVFTCGAPAPMAVRRHPCSDDSLVLSSSGPAHTHLPRV
jgi:hypothetical protein